VFLFLTIFFQNHFSCKKLEGKSKIDLTIDTKYGGILF
tara:strand:+ start:742 stop:855 length:114 start_codon:yes stop_codon:yes gene_type:complete